jgi:hypothetical protein
VRRFKQNIVWDQVFSKWGKITAILTIDDMLEPSLCSGAPSGITTFPVIFSTFGFAGLLQYYCKFPVPWKALCCFQNTLNPNFPPAM